MKLFIAILALAGLAFAAEPQNVTKMVSITPPVPTVHHLIAVPDQPFCLVRIVGRYPHCFVETGRVYPASPVTWAAVEIHTDEEVSAEMASGILLAAQLFSPYTPLTPPDEEKK